MADVEMGSYERGGSMSSSGSRVGRRRSRSAGEKNAPLVLIPAPPREVEALRAASCPKDPGELRKSKAAR